MAQLSALVLCVVTVWGMMLLCSSAEREYFPQSKMNVSWVDARKYCQRCFSELVTLTPENIQSIAKGLSSEHWIGLRKRPVNASDNSTIYPYNHTTTFWSQWANGDPLSFQNWYPGYPVFKSPWPRKDCCSCSCTCPAQPTTTASTTIATATTTTTTLTTTTTSATAITATTTAKSTATKSKYSVSTEGTTQWPAQSVLITTSQPTSAWTNTSIPISTQSFPTTTDQPTSAWSNTSIPSSTQSVPTTTDQPTSAWSNTSIPISTQSFPTTTDQPTSTWTNTSIPISTQSVPTTTDQPTSTWTNTSIPISTQSVPTTTDQPTSTWTNTSIPISTQLVPNTTDQPTSAWTNTSIPISTQSVPTTTDQPTSTWTNTSIPISTQSVPHTTGQPTSAWTNTSIPISTQSVPNTSGQPTNAWTNTSIPISTQSVPTTTDQPTSTWTNTSIPISTLSVLNTSGQPTSAWTNTSIPISTQSVPTTTDQPTSAWTNTSIPISTQSVPNTTDQPTSAWTNTSISISTQSVPNTSGQPTSTWSNTSIPISTQSVDTTTGQPTSAWTNTSIPISTQSVTNTSGQPTSTWTNTSIPISTESVPNTTDQPTSAWTNTSIPISTQSVPTTTGRTTSVWTNATTSISTQSVPSTTGHLASFESECVKTPMLFQEHDPDENYIEDSCVVILSFGAWVERPCSELLPFICYEDRFYGKVSVTDIKNSSANLSWLPGPGDISHYRLEVNNGSFHKQNYSHLNHSLTGLNPGTFYSVQVFPVKCGRDLNPENETFYTAPNQVTDLQEVNKTERCVSLSWTRPSGNVDLYIVNTLELKKNKVTKSESVTVCGLKPGSLHTFSVSSGVNDRSQHSEKSAIDVYTKPAQVSNLNISAITDSSLSLTWNKPEGKATGYRVTTSWTGNGIVSYKNYTNQTQLDLKYLPSGTKITLTITALTDNNLEGKILTADCFTLLEDITKLTLTSTVNTINATWAFTKGFPLFTVELLLGRDQIDSKNISYTTQPSVMFTGLNSAANYTVTVYSVTNQIRSSGVSDSIFTLPNPPRNILLNERNKTHLTFTWTPPIDTHTVTYSVSLNSSFWGLNWTECLDNKTTHTFGNLKSGSYYTFFVRTTAGDLESDPEILRAATESSEKEITLSMICSSNVSLLCNNNTTRESAFLELNSHFNLLLGDHVLWRLERVNGK